MNILLPICEQNSMCSCRKCGACCIAPSISSSLPGMPDGKPAGVACANLSDAHLCQVYEQRPRVCREFCPSVETCGNNYEEAMSSLHTLEEMTVPAMRMKLQTW